MEAAVVGIIAATSFQRAWTTARSVPSLGITGLIFIAALIAAWRLKPRWMPLLILGGRGFWPLRHILRSWTLATSAPVADSVGQPES